MNREKALERMKHWLDHLTFEAHISNREIRDVYDTFAALSSCACGGRVSVADMRVCLGAAIEDLARELCSRQASGEEYPSERVLDAKKGLTELWNGLFFKEDGPADFALPAEETE